MHAWIKRTIYYTASEWAVTSLPMKKTLKGNQLERRIQRPFEQKQRNIVNIQSMLQNKASDFESSIDLLKANHKLY